MNPGAEPLDVSAEELDALVERARTVALDEAGYQKLKAAVRTLSMMTAMLENPDTTLQSLRNMFRAGQSEKTAAVLKRTGILRRNHRRRRPSRKLPATAVMAQKPIVERITSRFLIRL